ncbi:MAG: hypothetical protein ACOYL6_12650 [Bacteriovoracaceae bacterium]
MVLQLTLVVLFFTFQVNAQELPCSSLFFEQPKVEIPLAHAFPDELIQGPLLERAQSLLQLWPNNVRLIEDVIVKSSSHVGDFERKKKFLVLSFDGLSDNKIAQLKKDYTSYLSYNAVSMPMGKGTGHLYTRVGNKVFDHDLTGFKSVEYEFSLYSERMESFISLSDQEFNHLRWYIHSIEKNYEEAMGSFSIDGPHSSQGKLDQNRGVGCSHNCTTWLTLAPVGDEGQSLKSLIKGKNYDIHRDPGWWTLYLQTKSPDERSPFVVYMADKSWNEIEQKIAPNKVFSWNYNLAQP